MVGACYTYSMYKIQISVQLIYAPNVNGILLFSTFGSEETEFSEGISTSDIRQSVGKLDALDLSDDISAIFL
jgi:hypothetical protein